MSSLSFPDVNVWLALLMADHVSRGVALKWWQQNETESMSFCRMTQLGVLRLLTTAAVMNQRPLTMRESWKAYTRLFDDSRVSFTAEPPGTEGLLKKLTSAARPSPKLWADAYLSAFATRAGGVVVTFDKALAAQNADSLLLR